MLKKLIIKNFQKHKNKVIRFDPYVTTIVGPNDAGKSAIIRALRWVTLNNPRGKQFIRRGAKETSVKITLDGHRIGREVKRESSRYTLDGKEYKAFRSSVPNRISKLSALLELNFQRQHEPAFWFNLSPGQVAKELNKLVDLDTIDTIQSDISSQLRQKKIELEAARQRLKDAKAEAKRLAWAGQIFPAIGGILTLSGGILSESLRIAQNERLIRSAVEHASRYRNATAAATRAAAAGRAATRAAAAGRAIARLTSYVKLSHHADPISNPPIFDSLAEKRKQIKALSELICHCETKEKKLWQSTSKLKRKKKGLEKKMGGRCPRCGGILSDQSLV